MFSSARASIIPVSSGALFDITNMSSANARRSPLLRTSSSLSEDLSASSRYTLKRTGERIEPCGSPSQHSCYECQLRLLSHCVISL